MCVCICVFVSDRPQKEEVTRWSQVELDRLSEQTQKRGHILLEGLGRNTEREEVKFSQ